MTSPIGNLGGPEVYQVPLSNNTLHLLQLVFVVSIS